MVEVFSITGTPVWVRVMLDAYPEEYGWYYEVYADENGDKLLDWGNTYDASESEEDVLEWACGVAENTDYGI